MLRRLAALAVACLLATPALADDDDDLAPIVPIKKAPAKRAPARKAQPPAKRQPVRPKPVAVDDDLAPLTPHVSRGDLTVRVPAGLAGAVLSIDNREVGTLPLGPQSLPAGEHLVTVRRAGFAGFSKKVTVAAGRPVELEARLAPVYAVLSVTADAPDAQVLINGQAIGPAPITDQEVPPGTIELTVVKDGRRDERRLTLVAGRDYPVAVRFNLGAPGTDRPLETRLLPSAVEPGPLAVTDAAPVAPLYQRWYFWAGVAAVVAAAAVGTAVGVTASQPPRKRTESEICTDRCSACIGLTCAGSVSSALSF
jgi:hypothetical protein